MPKIVIFAFGFAAGLTYAIFTGVEDRQLVQHNIAHYHKDTGELIWNDTNSTVH